jgi:DNA repair exonuclease SbcCD ATPase subunit
MRLAWIKASGFIGLKEPVTVRYAPGTRLIEGENGAGKSTLAVEALHWLLTGDMLREGYVEAAVNRDSGEALVEAAIEIPGSGELILRRRRGRKARASVLEAEGVGLEGVGGSNDEARAAVERALGMSLDAFVATAFYAPSRGLYGATDARRRELLEAVFGVGWIAPAQAKATKAAKDAEGLLNREREVLARAEAAAQAQAGGAAELRAQAVTARERGSRDDAAEAARLGAEADVLRRAAEEAAQERAATMAEVARAQGLVDRAQAKASKINDALNELFAERSRVVGSRSGIARALEAAETRAKGVLSGAQEACPTCLRPFTEGDRKAALEVLEGEQATARAQLAEADAELTDLDAGLAEVRKAKAYADAQAQLERDTCASAERRDRGALDHSTRVDTELRLRVLPALALAQAGSGGGREAEALEEAAAKAEVQAQAASRTAEEQRVRVTASEREAAALRWWKTAFGPKGVRAFVLEAALPGLSQKASYYLSRMSGGTQAVEVTPTKATRDGRETEAVSLLVRNVRGIDGPTGASTGEARCVDLALTLAMRDAAEARGARPLGVMALDEALDSVDATRAQAIVEVLGGLAARGTAVDVVSHSDEVRGLFPRRIFVGRGPGGWTQATGDGVGPAREPVPLPRVKEEDEEESGGAAPEQLATVLGEEGAALLALPKAALASRITTEFGRLRAGRTDRAAWVAKVNPGKRSVAALAREEAAALLLLLIEADDPVED